MTMQWFGRPWGSPVCDHAPHAETPVGEPCAWCDEPIEENDQGFLIPQGAVGPPAMRPFHYECQLRILIGGVNHQKGICVCCGGTELPDPPGLSRRKAALAAGAYHFSTH